MLSAGLIDQETAVRKVAPLLDVEDVDGLLRRVREEAETRKEEAAMEIPGMFPEPEPFEEAAPFGEPPPAEG